jgi:hypothetical protein
MQPQSLDYRHPATGVRRPPLVANVLLAVTAVAFLASLAWCILTWTTPGRFIFLPGGDVGLGFKSHAGLLQWIEYAPWNRANMDFPRWTAPWALVLAVEFSLLLLSVLFRRRSSRRAPL